MTTIEGVDRRARTPRIYGIGAYRPSRVIPNSEVIEAIDSSDEWIQQRSGHQAAPLGHPRGDRPADDRRRRRDRRSSGPASTRDRSTA